MDETPSSIPVADRPREPWGSWSALFQHSADPVFLLSRRRQIRYVNHAWEKLTGKSVEAMRGMFCLPRKKKGTQPLRLLLQALAPTPEVLEGRTATVRRPSPPARLGPPWWDVTFVPLRDNNGLTGILGFIRVVEAASSPTGASGLSEPLIALRQRTAARFSFNLLESEAPAMQRIEAQARLAARTKAPVWIVGEPGTGKETLARIIHFEGNTREQTFLPVDCPSLQPFLIRAMLFGHAGQATSQLGTIFLKNPAALPRDLQTEIVEWVEEQDHAPRIILSSDDLSENHLKAGRLLPEFYTAFNVLEIRVPPLRDRLDDLPTLTGAVLQKEIKEGMMLPELAPIALDRLRQHSWPGNLRELTRVLQEALVAAAGQRIETSHLPLELRAGMPKPPSKPAPPLDSVLEQVEARMISLALQKAKGNKSDAAERLGIPRGRLLRRIEALKIEDVFRKS